MTQSLYAAIEAGGTKFKCAIGDSEGVILESIIIPTESPKITIQRVKCFYQNSEYFDRIVSCGVGSFGPICLETNNAQYGSILDTPKKTWQNFNLLKALEQCFDVPIILDTDVNVAAIAEYYSGCAKNSERLAYVTVGTGIGVGILISGKSIREPMHPEMGHILVLKHPDDPIRKGSCLFHMDCLEGLASGPAMQERWEIEASELSFDHKAWEIEAHYLAQLCLNLQYSIVPEKIILGGGVMLQKHLLPMIRDEFYRLLGGYLVLSKSDVENLIVEPYFGNDAGMRGALQLAMNYR